MGSALMSAYSSKSPLHHPSSSASTSASGVNEFTCCSTVRLNIVLTYWVVQRMNMETWPGQNPTKCLSVRHFNHQHQVEKSNLYPFSDFPCMHAAERNGSGLEYLHSSITTNLHSVVSPWLSSCWFRWIWGTQGANFTYSRTAVWRK